MTDPLIELATQVAKETVGEFEVAHDAALSALRTQKAMIAVWFRRRADETSNLQLMAELRAEADAIEQDAYLKGRG